MRVESGSLMLCMVGVVGAAGGWTVAVGGIAGRVEWGSLTPRRAGVIDAPWTRRDGVKGAENRV